MIYTDQTGFAIDLKSAPSRIISLVPSQTELLAFLGLENETVGITRFCVHPQNWHEQKTKVGGTKQFDMDVIRELQPDLIIGNKEENYESGIAELRKHYPVWMSDVNTIQDALNMISHVGEMCGKATAANRLTSEIQLRFAKPEVTATRRSAYFIWRKPYMVAASSTFIHAMMECAGFENIFAEAIRYPEVSLSDVAHTRPDIILLSSEPYHFTENHFQEFREMCPDAKVVLVDGEMFSWYGPRMLKAAEYFGELNEFISRG